MQETNNQIQNLTDTKQKMADALRIFIKDKPFSKITVGDIVTACSMNRNSFYYHFGNMYDLLYWTYNQSIQKILSQYLNSSQDITHAFDCVLDYIDSEKELCKTAYESIGESDFKNMLENDIHRLLNAAIDYSCQNTKKKITADFKDFLIYNFTQMLEGQIIWYIKYSDNLDKPKFLEYIRATLFNSLSATISAVGE